MQELISEDAICQYCGKIHYQTVGASLMDRESKKTIKNVAFNRPILYVTDYFFAFDKDNSNGAALMAGGAAGFGIVGALVGGLADEVVGAARRSLKRKTTALYYEWKDVSSLSYPMKPWPAKRFQVNLKAETGIDVTFKDGSELAVWINVTDIGKGKELYDVMNLLHQKGLTRIAMDQSNGMISAPDSATDSVVSLEESSKLKAAGDVPLESGAERVKPMYQAGMAADSSPVFFKCPSCGITQMREGDSCLYCGQPVPAESPGIQSASGQQVSSAQQAVPIGDQKTCPSCGTVQKPGNKFCVRCGQKLPDDQPKESFCPLCGSKVTEGMLFCGECGTRLD